MTVLIAALLLIIAVNLVNYQIVLSVAVMLVIYRTIEVLKALERSAVEGEWEDKYKQALSKAIEVLEAVDNPELPSPLSEKWNGHIVLGFSKGIEACRPLIAARDLTIKKQAKRIEDLEHELKRIREWVNDHPALKENHD